MSSESHSAWGCSHGQVGRGAVLRGRARCLPSPPRLVAGASPVSPRWWRWRGGASPSPAPPSHLLGPGTRSLRASKGEGAGLRPWGGRAVTGGVSEMLVGALGVGALAERRATLLGRGFGSAAEHREGLAGAPMPPGPEAVPGRWENK